MACPLQGACSQAARGLAHLTTFLPPSPGSDPCSFGAAQREPVPAALDLPDQGQSSLGGSVRTSAQGAGEGASVLLTLPYCTCARPRHRHPPRPRRGSPLHRLPGDPQMPHPPPQPPSPPLRRRRPRCPSTRSSKVGGDKAHAFLSPSCLATHHSLPPWYAV